MKLFVFLFLIKLQKQLNFKFQLHDSRLLVAQKMFQRGILNCRNVLNGIGVKSFKNGSNSILINNKLGIQGRSAFSTTQQQQSINNSNSINSISNKVNSEGLFLLKNQNRQRFRD